MSGGHRKWARHASHIPRHHQKHHGFGKDDGIREGGRSGVLNDYRSLGVSALKLREGLILDEERSP